MAFLLLGAGLVAGLIDSIAGGGGLITLPILILALGTPVDAIASNKIVGFVGAFIALLVYRRAGHLDWKKGAVFTAWVTLGSLVGSSLTPIIPAQALKGMVVVVCPVILALVWRRESWMARTRSKGSLKKVPHLKLALSGLGCGLYDGAFGPGGGTFMFLALLYVVGLPLMPAMAVTKLSNSFSAGTALGRFTLSGHVHWVQGGIMATGMALGAFIGARFANEKAAEIVRPVLTLVVILLLLRMWMS